jgi:acyl dehydratase
VSRSLYFEDLVEGSVFDSPGRTITEADLFAFAALSGDWNPIHVDEEFARGTLYGRRVVHGALGIAVITGLLDRMGIFADSILAALEIVEWRYLKPLFVGDTVRFQMTITGTRLVSDGRRGVVDRQFELFNQHGDVLQRGSMRIMVACRSDLESATPPAA